MERIFGELDKIKYKISSEYSKGRINSEHYSNFKEEICLIYHEIVNNRIDNYKN